MKKTTPTGVMMMTALLTANPEKREELSQTLDVLVGKIRDHSGCIEGMVGQDLGNPAQFLLYLVWEQLAAMEAFLASEDFRVLLGASSILAGPTTFRFTTSHLAVPAAKAGQGRSPALAKAGGGLPSGP